MSGVVVADHVKFGSGVGGGLVFTASTGGRLSAGTVRRWFKEICERADLSRDWTPQELRHTFFSLLRGNGMLIEEIADLVGHSSTQTTGTVYRRQLRPVLRAGAVAVTAIFAGQPKPEDGQEGEPKRLSPVRPRTAPMILQRAIYQAKRKAAPPKVLP